VGTLKLLQIAMATIKSPNKLMETLISSVKRKDYSLSRIWWVVKHQHLVSCFSSFLHCCVCGYLKTKNKK